MLKFVVDLTQTTIMPGGLDYDKHGRIARVKPRIKTQTIGALSQAAAVVGGIEILQIQAVEQLTNRMLFTADS